MGLSIWRLEGKPTPVRIRFLGLNAPELRDPGGLEARDYLAALLPQGSLVWVVSHRLEGAREQDNFARVLATVELMDGKDVGVLLVDSGHAVWT